MPKSSHPAKAYTAKDMAEMLHIKLQQVQRNANNHKYPFAYKEGKCWLFKRAGTDEYVKELEDYQGLLHRIQKKEVSKMRCDTFSWSKPDSVGRCRINCGGSGVIERQGERGSTYRFWWKDEKGKRQAEQWPEAINREQAEKKFLRILGAKFDKVNGFKLEESDGFVGDFMVTKFLNLSSTNKAYQRLVETNLYPFFRNYRFSDLTFEVYCNYLAQRRKEAKENGYELSDGTLLNDSAVLKRVLNVAVKFRKDVNPKLVVDTNTAGLNSSERERILEPEERPLLYAKANEFWKDLLDFALNTGLRLNNICRLKWAAVKTDARNVVRIVISGQESKNKKQFRIKVNPVVARVLKKLKALNGHQEYVFLRNGNGDAKPLDNRWVQRGFKNLTEEAGIEDLHFHDLRRTFGQTLVGLGIDLLAIQKAMAHKSLQSTLRYVRADEDKVDEAFDKIGDFWGKNRVNSNSGAEPIQQLNTLEQVS